MIDPLERDLFRRIQDRMAIVGIGHLPFAKDIGRPIGDTAVEAIQLALDDAGLAAEDVDGMSMFEMEHTHEVTIARRLGVTNLRWWDKISYGGGASCATIMHACAAIASGLASVVVCHRARNRGAKTSRPVVAGKGPDDRRQGPARAVGAHPPGRRHRHVGAPPHARVRHHARALRQRRHRRAQARAAQPVRDDARPPARHGDVPERRASSAIRCTCTTAAWRPTARWPASSPRSSGRATCGSKPALVHSVAQASGPNPVHLANYNTPEHADHLGAVRRAALVALASCSRKDMDCAQIYDAFTPLVITGLEDYGFCKRGEGGPFTEGGRIELGGELPVLTSGGGLSEAYVHGFNLILEGVRQIRGTSYSQVPDCTGDAGHRRVGRGDERDGAAGGVKAVSQCAGEPVTR